MLSYRAFIEVNGSYFNTNGFYINTAIFSNTVILFMEGIQFAIFHYRNTTQHYSCMTQTIWKCLKLTMTLVTICLQRHDKIYTKQFHCSLTFHPIHFSCFLTTLNQIDILTTRLVVLHQLKDKLTKLRGVCICNVHFIAGGAPNPMSSYSTIVTV